MVEVEVRADIKVKIDLLSSGKIDIDIEAIGQQPRKKAIFRHEQGIGSPYYSCRGNRSKPGRMERKVRVHAGEKVCVHVWKLHPP